MGINALILFWIIFLLVTSRQRQPEIHWKPPSVWHFRLDEQLHNSGDRYMFRINILIFMPKWPWKSRKFSFPYNLVSYTLEHIRSSSSLSEKKMKDERKKCSCSSCASSLLAWRSRLIVDFATRGLPLLSPLSSKGKKKISICLHFCVHIVWMFEARQWANCDNPSTVASPSQSESVVSRDYTV